MITPRLQYFYACYNTETGVCESVFTASYVIDYPGFVQIPIFSNVDVGKYYNQSNGLWYNDAEFTQPFNPEA